MSPVQGICSLAPIGCSYLLVLVLSVDTDANNFYKDKSFKQYKGRHSMGWNLFFPFI